MASTNIFVGYHHFEKGLSTYYVILDGGVLPIYYNFTWHPAPNRADLGAAFEGVNLVL